MSRFRLVKIKFLPKFCAPKWDYFWWGTWGVHSGWHQCLSMDYTDKSSSFTSSGMGFKTAAEKPSS